MYGELQSRFELAMQKKHCYKTRSSVPVLALSKKRSLMPLERYYMVDGTNISSHSSTIKEIRMEKSFTPFRLRSPVLRWFVRRHSATTWQPSSVLFGLKKASNGRRLLKSRTWFFLYIYIYLPRTQWNKALKPRAWYGSTDVHSLVARVFVKSSPTT